MGIEDWGELDSISSDVTEEIVQIERVVDDPRRHSLGGFLPGRGFSPSEAETYESPDSLDFDETSDAPFPDATAAAPFKG